MSKKNSPWNTTTVHGRYMGYFEGKTITKKDGDIVSTMNNPALVHRPDLLSQLVYSTPDYWWVFGVVNEWSDPVFDQELGVEMIIPHPSRVSEF